MPDIETGSAGGREVAQIVGDPDLHHPPRVGAGGRGRHPNRAAERLSEETLAGDIGRMNHGVVTKAGEGIPQLQRMNDTAARIGGMRKDGDAQAPHGVQPIRGCRAKSQTVSRALPSRISTTEPAVTAPTSAAAMPRALKRPTASSTWDGGTARM